MNRTLLLVLLWCGCGPEAMAPEAVPPAPVAQEVEQAPLTGFPCEVRDILQASCAGCHVGAVYLPRFEARADLAAEGAAARFSERLRHGASQPMPPQGSRVSLSEDQRAVLLDWLSAGTPAGACGPLSQ